MSHTLDELPYTVTTKIELDVLARLAAAAGFEARGDRVNAEHHLGMALGMLSRGGNSPLVTVAEVKPLLSIIAGLARGKPAPAPIIVASRKAGICSICGRPWENGHCSFMPEQHSRLGREVASH